MSDKKIQIDVKVAGADEAASQVKKIKPAVEAAAGSIKAMEKEVVDATKAYKAAVTGTDEFVAASKRLEVAKANLTEATKKVTASGFNMKSSIQNVGYQVQDLAVQIGSGTSAFVAFGQQAPQLLSGFGPVGVMLGTLAAVALPLAGAMFKLGDETEGTGKKADATSDKLEKLREKAAELAEQKAEKAFTKFIEGLDRERDAVVRQNDALRDNLELLRAKKLAEAETEEAKREAQIAIIEADPDKAETQKIAEVANIKEQSAKAATQRRLDELAKGREDAALKLQQTQNLEKKERENLAKIEAEKQGRVDEKESLRGKLVKANAGNARIPEIDKELKALAQELSRASQSAGQVGLSQNELKKFQSRRENLEKERESAVDLSNSISPGERTKIESLTKQIKDDEAQLEEQRKAIGKAEAERKTAEAAVKNAEQKQKDVAPQIIEQYTQQKVGRDASAGAAIFAAQRRIDEEAKQKREKGEAEAEKRRKEDMESRLDTGGNTLDDDARRYGRSASKQGLATGNKALSQIGEKLSDGTNAAELQKIGDLLTDKYSELGEKNVGILKDVLSRLEKQSQQLEVLRGQIKNKRER